MTEEIPGDEFLTPDEIREFAEVIDKALRMGKGDELAFSYGEVAGLLVNLQRALASTDTHEGCYNICVPIDKLAHEIAMVNCSISVLEVLTPEGGRAAVIVQRGRVDSVSALGMLETAKFQYASGEAPGAVDDA